MVDPNRKINHLTDEDVKYLNECENEFKNRFTEDDEEFMALCNQPTPDPPTVTPWMQHRSGNSGNYRGNRGGNYNQRPYHHRSNRGGGNFNRNYHNNEGGGYRDRRGMKRSYNYNGGNDNPGKYHNRDFN